MFPKFPLASLRRDKWERGGGCDGSGDRGSPDHDGRQTSDGQKCMDLGCILKAESAGLADERDGLGRGEKGGVKDHTSVLHFSHSDGGDSDRDGGSCKWVSGRWGDSKSSVQTCGD